MTAIVKTTETLPAVQNYSDGLLEVIARAARDPAVDIDKMERLLMMQERVQARDAHNAYTAALALMQPELPVIIERGGIKNNAGAVQSTYALWEDINEAIKPHLAAHGFALSFRTGLAADGRITVTGVLSHRAGHQEETTMTLPHDSSGSKNAVQAVGSSTSYGKRYTAQALLNLTSRGEDDDGTTATPSAKAAQRAAWPEGPYTSKTALSTAWKAFAYHLDALQTSDDVEAAIADAQPMLAQFRRASKIGILTADYEGFDDFKGVAETLEIARNRVKSMSEREPDSGSPAALEPSAVPESVALMLQAIGNRETKAALVAWQKLHADALAALDEHHKAIVRAAYSARIDAVNQMDLTTAG